VSALALLVLLLPGVALVLAAIGRPRSGGPALLLGEGWLLGALLAGLCTWLPPASVPARAFAGSLPWLAATTIAGLSLAWRLRRTTGALRGGQDGPAADPAGVAWWLLLVLVVLHLLLALWQAVLLPTVPWDAWTTWLGRARSWSGADAFVPLLAPSAWLDAEGAARATLAPHYPTLLSRLAVWIASAAGGWDSAAVHLAWPALGASLAAGLYGHLRRARVAARPAMVATFACLSLPLLNAHLSLAGYADLWLATALLYALMHGLQWRRGRGRGDLVLALAFALVLPLLKLEGAVWLLCLLLAAAWSQLPARWQWASPLALLLLVALVLPFAAVPLPVPGLGTVRIGWGEIAIPAMGTLALHWRGVTSEVLETLFVLPNWHLLWIAMPLLLLARWRGLGEPALRAAAAFLLLAFLFLFVLFFFTEASAWAENLTSINRLVLQVAPSVVAFLALLWSAPVAAGVRAAPRATVLAQDGPAEPASSE
jgi:hypothetical protein